jgi:hypothetical protein
MATDACFRHLRSCRHRALYRRILSASCPVPVRSSTGSSLGARSGEPRGRWLRVRNDRSCGNGEFLSASDCNDEPDRSHWLDQPAASALSRCGRVEEIACGAAFYCKRNRHRLHRNVDSAGRRSCNLTRRSLPLDRRDRSHPVGTTDESAPRKAAARGLAHSESEV